MIRSLQLDSKAAQTWAALGRLYMQAGACHLADSCYAQARSQDPADPATWTAMGALAGLSATGEQMQGRCPEDSLSTLSRLTFSL